MSGFIFSLAKNTHLEENHRGCFLVSRAPLRILRVNGSLFSILRKLPQGNDVSQLVRQSAPGTGEAPLLSVLLSLTGKGYLRLDNVADLVNYPFVSVIVPVRFISDDLIECVDALTTLDYPGEKLEVIVVEDGAPENRLVDLTALNVKRIRLPESRGPATARNAGASQAKGEILAFLDADCVADKNWLKETIPFLQVAGIGAVGGFVDGFYKKGLLDRYEAVFSSLNMGPRLVFESDNRSGFYVPSCNMLVSRQAFYSVGGFKDGLRLGEDVDFCWRLRNQGYGLLYIPKGRVFHKHRNRLFKMLSRKSAYGSSESPLYLSHCEKRKRFPLPVYSVMSFLALVSAILLVSPYPLFLILLFLGLDVSRKSVVLNQFGSAFTLWQIGFSALRSQLSFYYFASFHVIRYYLILLLGLGFLFHPLWLYCIVAVLLTSIVDYLVKKPGLLYPVFLLYYVLEHLAYQLGVFWGCLKSRYFMVYLPAFTRA